MGADVCAGVGVAEVHDRLRQHVGVGDLLKTTDINLAARLRGPDGEHWPEDRGKIRIAGDRAVGGGVVKVCGDLQEPVDGGCVLVCGIDLDVVQAEAQL